MDDDADKTDIQRNDVSSIADVENKGSEDDMDEAKQKITPMQVFENVTLVIISLNALWMSIDTELNFAAFWTSSDCHPVFVVMEHFFCTYFVIEIVVRFVVRRPKRDLLSDGWFIFDSFLVFLMVAETWVLAIVALASDEAGGGNSMNQISLLRLLRLLRLTRIMRIMRHVPELLTLINAMVQALISVGASLVLLVACLYVFGIIFTMRYHEQRVRDDHPEYMQTLSAEFFGDLWISVITLFVMGCLLDDITAVVQLLREDWPYMVVFFVFVVLASFTILNMLIGIMAEVVVQTADSEKEVVAKHTVRSIMKDLYSAIDQNGDGTISHVEFDKMLEDERALKAVKMLGIKEERLDELSKQIFEDDSLMPESDGSATRRSVGPAPEGHVGRSSEMEDGVGHKRQGTWYHPGKELTFPQFMDELMSLQSGDALSVRDIAAASRRLDEACRRLDGAIMGAASELGATTTELCQRIGKADVDVVAEKVRHKPPKMAKGSHVEEENTNPFLSGRPLSIVPTTAIIDEVNRRLRGESTIAR